MRIEFHPEALAEFRDAAEFYEKQQHKLGTRFTNAIESAITRIGEAPTSWRTIEEDVRRYLTKVFPYAVLDSIEDGYILIVAIMDCHREPAYWRIRL